MNSSTPASAFQLLYSGADDLLRHAQGMMLSDKMVDFIDSVRWNEPFIRGVLLGQIMLFFFTYMTRKYDVVQFGVLCALTGITFAAKRINEMGNRNWSKFASQDYFDSSGLFMLVFVSGPFVVLSNFIVIGMGLRLVNLYVKKLRTDIRRRQREQQPESRRQEQGQRAGVGSGVQHKKDD